MAPCTCRIRSATTRRRATGVDAFWALAIG